MTNYWSADDWREWPRKKAMCMLELEEGGHDDGGGDRDGGDVYDGGVGGDGGDDRDGGYGGDGDNNREEKKAKIKTSIQGSHRIPKF